MILDNVINEFTEKIKNKNEYTQGELKHFIDEIKELKMEKKSLDKELKNIIIIEREPKTVIEHINNCFNKKNKY